MRGRHTAGLLYGKYGHLVSRLLSLHQPLKMVIPMCGSNVQLQPAGGTPPITLVMCSFKVNTMC